MSVHFATPGGTAGANSMGSKTKNVGIWAQATKNIKAGTAVKADGFAPMPPCPPFPGEQGDTVKRQTLEHEIANCELRLAAIAEHGHVTVPDEVAELTAIKVELAAKLAALDRGTLILVTTAHPSLHQHELDGEIHPNLGRLIQPRHTSSIEATAAEGIPWAADNDCFQGLKPEAFERMLDRIEGLPGCLFVTVPDVVEDAEATAAMFEEWAPELEARGLPLGFVAQDGLEDLEVPWDRIAALFIGGSTDWKLGPHAAELAREASRRGKWVHWGRVNSRKRFDLIRATGACDSFDGSKWARFRHTYLDDGLAWCLPETPDNVLPFPCESVPKSEESHDLQRAA